MLQKKSQKKIFSCILGDPKITKSHFFATYLSYNSKTKAQTKKCSRMEPPPKMTQKSKKIIKSTKKFHIFLYIYFLPLGQKQRLWEMCNQPNIVPRPTTN